MDRTARRAGARTQALAARIVAELHPRQVHVADDPTLRDALRARGVEATVDEQDCDLAVSHGHTNAPALHILTTAPDDGMEEWLVQLAEGGLQPVLEFDATEFAPTGVLLERTGRRADRVLLEGCVRLIRARADLARRADALARDVHALEQRQKRQAQAQQHAIGLNTALQDRLLMTEARLAIALNEREIIVSSTMWRATAPLRRLIDRLRPRRHDGAARLADQGLGASAYEQWVARHDTLDAADRAGIRAHIEQLAICPVISVVMPAYDTDEALLRAAIGSVRGQLYPHWQLCVADDASPGSQVARVLAECAGEDPRIRWIRCEVNGNISAATNAALTLATGEFIALMDHDDLLPAHALYEVAVELDAHPDADMVFSDEDQIDPQGRRTMPYFKPDWNMDLMRAHNMVSHLGVYRRALVEQLGGARVGYEGSQDYDLALRVADASMPARVRHIPSVLYHWRQHATSFSKERIDACVAAARLAIADHLERTGEAAQTRLCAAPGIPTWSRVVYALPDPAPRVSLIVPTRDRAELLERCVDGLLHRTEYPDLELIIADNDSVQPRTAALLADLQRDRRVKILRCPGAFNYAAMNNQAVTHATGTVLGLINNDIEVLESGWLAEMVSQALRQGIGAVGARLLFADGTVQHAGVVLGVGNFDAGPGVAGHFSLHDPATSLGYFGASALVHEVSAVTAACMVLRKSLWEEAGGMDAENLAVAFNDVDLCLRLRALGRRNLVTPHAELLHHESASRGDDLAPEHSARFARECRFMRDRWGPVLDADPFYNPNFARLDGMFRLVGSSGRRKPWQ